MNLLPLLTALKTLSIAIERMEKKIDDMQAQIESMQEEWRNEFEIDFGEEDEETESCESSSDAESVQSCPASFSLYKRQRI